MRITRLHLTDFKTHAELELEPAPGLTIIRGPNEAGKSSIQQAIELVLFRKADANREDIRQAWAWGSDLPPMVELDFEVDGKSGTLRKSFAGARADGSLTLAGHTVKDYTLMQDEIGELIGVPTEAFYRATASVGHAELAAVAGDEPTIGDRLQKAISGADRGTATAKKKLETAIHRYRTEGHKNPGLLKVTRAQITSLESELTNGERALSRLEADRATWVEAHERREDLDTQLNRQQADLAEAQRAETLAERRDDAQDRWERLKRAGELTTQKERHLQEQSGSMPLAQLRSTVPRCQALEFELSELEAELDTAVEAADVEGSDVVPPRPMAWLAAAAILVVVGWAAMFLLRDAGMLGIILVAGLGVAVIFTLAQAARLAGRRRQSGLAMQMAENAVVEHQQQGREQQELHRRKSRELESLLASMGVPSVSGAVSLLEAAEAQTEQVAQIDGELRGLRIEEHNIRRIEEARDEAANEAELARHALAAMGSLAEDPATARVESQRLVAQTGPARDAARSEEDQSLGRIDANTIDAEIVAGLAERLTAARERLADLEARLFVYQATLAAIEAAEAATLKTAARYLEERMGPTISRVTAGRYDDIEVDEKSLDFKVRAPESGELVEVEQLSQGTADQLFLAARLGLVLLVTLDRQPPLILDDPFVTFDADRGERALRQVRELSHEQGFQVLYLTCSDRFDALADELVVLPGPSQDEALAESPTAVVAAVGAAGGESGKVGQATLFAADSQPERDSVAPRRRTPEKTAADPLASLRKTAAAATDAKRDTGSVDPFKLVDSPGNGAPD